jgi:hypothetical protein
VLIRELLPGIKAGMALEPSIGAGIVLVFYSFESRLEENKSKWSLLCRVPTIPFGRSNITVMAMTPRITLL